MTVDGGSTFARMASRVRIRCDSAVHADKERPEHEFRSFLWKHAEEDLIQHESGTKRNYVARAG